MSAVGGCLDSEFERLLPGVPHRRDARERLLINATENCL